MIVTYFRSSSYTEWDFCPHKYFLDYTLGFHSPANKKAQKGSIVHKVLEILAQYKLAKQEGKEGFSNEELQQHFSLHDDITPNHIITMVYRHYVNKHEFEYEDKDLQDCQKWVWDVLLWKDGMFSPLQMDILSPEQYFDFEIREPWAEYSYKLADGTKLEGYLALKGTIDLTVRRPNNVLEIVDWKTGARMNWNKMQKKEYTDFQNDPQLLIYHYAAHKLYPEADNIFCTIYYIQDGGPYSICFQKKDLQFAEDMLRRRFNEIRHTYKPHAIYPNMKCNWCWFKSHGFDGPVDNYKDSICNQTRTEIIKLGIDRVTARRAKPDAFTAYNEGGGRSNVK